MLRRNVYIALICATLAYTGSPCLAKGNPTPSPCQLALEACVDVVKAQDEQIKGLKADREDLANRLADAQARPLIPGWMWGVVGIAAGAFLVTLAK